MKKASLSDTSLLEKLRAGGTAETEALALIYRRERPMVLHFVQKNGGNLAQAKDVFQEAVIRLYENVKARKFRGESSISVYLYAIARFYWLNQLKRQKIERRIIDTQIFNDQDTLAISDFLDRETEAQLFELFSELGKDCQSILIKVYYEQLSMEDIREHLQYSSAQVVRNQKYRCLQRLKKLLSDRPDLLKLLKRNG